jgi:hypothetical protein
VLAKHSKNFSLEDSLAIGVDRMHRNFGPFTVGTVVRDALMAVLGDLKCFPILQTFMFC